MVNCRKSLEFGMYTSSSNTSYNKNRRPQPWIGRCLQRRLEQARVLYVVKLPRIDGNIIGYNTISDNSKIQERAYIVGKHYINPVY